MKTINLTQGQVALVDDADFERVNCFKWFALWNLCTKSYYAARSDYSGEKQRTIYMHRSIIGEPVGMLIDHKNHDTLDNRQENLRVCSKSQNNRNSKKYRRKCSSEYKGVSWYKAAKKWMACIRIGGKTKYLGYFIDEQEAARAYDTAALKHFGEYALTNFS